MCLTTVSNIYEPPLQGVRTGWKVATYAPLYVPFNGQLDGHLYIKDATPVYQPPVKQDVMYNDGHGLFFLQHGKQFVGNSPLWWADPSGYTTHINKAKRFTQDEAEQIIRSTKSSHDFRMWEVPYVLAAATLQVDAQNLGTNPYPQPR
jgi:hypothetical protein